MPPKTTYEAREVFTPSMPARVTFIERDSQINNDLVDALKTPGQQIIVYGHTGSGKTTLLVNLLDRVYSDYVRIICDKKTTIDDILRQALERAGAMYVSSRQSTRTRKTGATAKGTPIPSLTFELTGTKEGTESVGQQPVVTPQVTPQRVAEALGEREACLLLEDFYKLPVAEKDRMSDVMKVFVDVASTHRWVKLIATGAVGTAREVVQYEPTLKNRVAEILVPLMSPSELRQILVRGEKALNLTMSPVVRDSVLEYAGGLPAVCHQLALHMCSAAGVEATMPLKTQIQVQHLTAAVRKYLSASSDSLKMKFDRAFRRERHGEYDNCRLILTALATFPQEGATHGQIIQRIHDKLASYPAGNLGKYLKQLQQAERGEIVVFDAVSGNYSFADPLDRAFMKLLVDRPPLPTWQRQMRLSEEVMDRVITDLFDVYLQRFRRGNGE